MIRLTTKLIMATAMLVGTGGLVSGRADAQAGTRRLVIFGNDPCPRDAICITKPEKDRYRLPKDQQLQGTRQERQSWAQKSKQLMTAGNTGTGQCSPVGPGGHTGCLTREINQARQDAAEQQEQNTAPER
jgi:hypothetical protein